MNKYLKYALIALAIVVLVVLNYIFSANLFSLEMSLERILSIVSTIILIFALFVSISEFRKNNNISKSNFLLELREKFMIERRLRIYKALRNEEKIEDWTDLDDYLGLFEICEIMIKNKTIEFQNFEKLYKYRLRNILCNKEVVFYKLVEESDSWIDLYSLLDRSFPECSEEFNALKTLKNKDVKIGSKDFSDIMTQIYLKLNIENKITT